MELVILRHGTTPNNEQRRYTGSTDVPLSAAGVEQARELHERLAAADAPPLVGLLAMELVYVSPLLRARQTAQLVFPAARQEAVHGLEEMCFGDFEGRNASEMENDAAYRAWVDGGCVGVCPGGESRAQFTERICAAVAEVLRRAHAAGLPRAVVVAHGGTIMAAFSHLADEPRGYYDWLVPNCCGYAAQASCDGGMPRLSHCLRIPPGDNRQILWPDA